MEAGCVFQCKGTTVFEDAPIGTRAPASGGGHWVRVESGWKWCTGATFSRPGGDWTGELLAPRNDGASVQTFGVKDAENLDD